MPRPVVDPEDGVEPLSSRRIVGGYRIIYDIEDDELVILILRVGHRRDGYRRG